jgi:hypothetical protein
LREDCQSPTLLTNGRRRFDHRRHQTPSKFKTQALHSNSIPPWPPWSRIDTKNHRRIPQQLEAPCARMQTGGSEAKTPFLAKLSTRSEYLAEPSLGNEHARVDG